VQGGGRAVAIPERREIKQGYVSNSVSCGLEAPPEVSRMAGRTLSGSCRDRDLRNEELHSGEGADISVGSGVVVGGGGDCSFDSLGGNAVAAEPVGTVQPSNLHGFLVQWRCCGEQSGGQRSHI
jgi:hypothetical protein